MPEVEPFHQQTTCASCQTRVTVAGLRGSLQARQAAYNVPCPGCGREVRDAADGIDPATVIVICYEKPKLAL
jgi:hypothetical protein